MNAAQLHLLVNHVPILVPFFAALLLGTFFLWKKDGFVQAALVLLVVGGLGAVGAYVTGEPAEEVLEGMAGVAEQRIEVHEEAAEVAWIVLALAGGASALTLVIWRTRALPRWLPPAALLVSLVLGGWMAYVGHLGGGIRHPETRGTFGGAAETGAPLAAPVPYDD